MDTEEYNLWCIGKVDNTHNKYYDYFMTNTCITHSLYSDVQFFYDLSNPPCKFRFIDASINQKQQFIRELYEQRPSTCTFIHLSKNETNSFILTYWGTVKRSLTICFDRANFPLKLDWKVMYNNTTVLGDLYVH